MPRLLRSERARYLVVGGWNTAFGYGVGVAAYLWLSHVLQTVWIAALANVVSITMSFVMYKIFVFRSKGRWLAEYLRCYVVYGGTSLLGIAMLWLLIDRLHLTIWSAQAMIIASTVAVSYLGHARFTFRRH